MNNVPFFIAGMGMGAGAAVAASVPLPSWFDWRVPALVVAIAAGVLWGIRRARIEALRMYDVRRPPS